MRRQTILRVVSKLLSEQTRLLGFVARPPADRMVLDHVTLVRITSDRILAVLVSKTGSSYRRIVWDEAGLDDRQLERISALLRERVEREHGADLLRIDRQRVARREELERVLESFEPEVYTERVARAEVRALLAPARALEDPAARRGTSTTSLRSTPIDRASAKSFCPASGGNSSS